MKLKKIFFCLLPLTFFLKGLAQPPVKENLSGDTAKVNKLLDESKALFIDDPEKSINLSTQAVDLADKINFQKGKAYALKNIGIAYYFQGKYLEALQYYTESVHIFEELKDNVGIANLYNNIGVIHYDQGDDIKALDYYLKSLKYAELSGDKLRILSALNNVGGVYNIKKATHEKALQYYLKALPLCEELDKTEELGAICVNIGSLYFEMGDDAKALSFFDKALKAYGSSENSLNVYNAMGKLYRKEAKYDLALQYHNLALALAERSNNKISLVQCYMGLGNVFMDKKDYNTAISYFKKAEVPALEVQANHELKDLYQYMANAFAKTSDYGNAFKYQTLYSNIKDTIYSLATDKKLAGLQFDFDLQKKEAEINLLTKDKDLTDLQLKRQQYAKKVLIIGLGLVFLIALLIYRNYRVKAKTHKILDKQKDEIEGLLLNILPAPVAKELQLKGHAEPKYYESVSVMFTDFKAFTAIADKMAPQDLVEELNSCFRAFDEIIGRNNLEKIKTIGDSYMCAGSIPTQDDQHVGNMIKAGMEIRDFMSEYNEKRKEAGLETWDLRIGIHVGPVVAGVVGKKKYAYDIWGSTVNIASRMESNGVPGQINISSHTYDLIKHKYACTYRGKIDAKNIGEIDMYLVEGEVSRTKTQYKKKEKENEGIVLQ